MSELTTKSAEMMLTMFPDVNESGWRQDAVYHLLRIETEAVQEALRKVFVLGDGIDSNLLRFAVLTVAEEYGWDLAAIGITSPPSKTRWAVNDELTPPKAPVDEAVG